MPQLAIKAQGLFKEYRIGTAARGKLTLRESIYDMAAAPFRQIISRKHRNDILRKSTILALDNVSFEVGQGEIVGIIGSNGAGKSTLLKILAKITKPSKGSILLKGRVGSLLEIGTGFHPELSGYENIFLYGSILGMRRKEIFQRLDEIISFAEIEKFIYTPVKRYSSGMYMRLAFAVAAQLEPDILVVDEVLAVGDARFQKKCLGRMGEVSHSGRTVIFVSHNMQAIRTLCQRAILLDRGTIIADGPADVVADKYLREIPSAQTNEDLRKFIQTLPLDPTFKLESVSLKQNGQPVFSEVANGSPLDIEMTYRVMEKSTGLRIYFDICDLEGILLFQSFHDEQEDGIPSTDPGMYVSRSHIPANLLGPIQYSLRIHAGIHNVRSCLPKNGVCISLNVNNTGKYNRAYLTDTFRGKLAPVIAWETERTHE